MSAPTIWLSAGEPSGDGYAASLASALRERMPGARLEGMGGPLMDRAGVDLHHRSDDLAAVGLLEAAASLPAHLRILADVRRRFRNGAHALAVLVDYPGFHLAVARAARATGIPVLHYIAPQLWAWGRWRTGPLRDAVDRLAVILPFEQPFFRARGIDARFVGHPLLERAPVARRDARAALGLGPTDPVLALFPGSRRREVATMWPLLRDAAHILRHEMPELAVIVAGVDGVAYAEARDIAVTVDDAGLVAAAADAALCKLGTTTLQAALADTPHVVAYRTGHLTYGIARRVVRVPRLGLVNLVAGRDVVPELLQAQATPRALARAVRPLLDTTSPDAERQRRAFSTVREQLGSPGAAGRVARLAAELVA